MTSIARNVTLLIALVLVTLGAALWLVLPDRSPLPEQAARVVESPAPDAAEPVVGSAPSGNSSSRAEPEVMAAADRIQQTVSTAPATDGLVAKYVDFLLEPQRGHDSLWNISQDVHRKAGLDGQRRLFAAVAANMASGDPRRPAMLLGQIEAARRLGLAEATALLPEMILAMDPDWARERYGLPRLVAFAGGPNVSPWSAEERQSELRQDLRNAMWTISGAGGWDGGTWVVWSDKGWTGDAFFAWVGDVARDDSRPEAAMAASIWVHAVLARHHWQKPLHGLVPAASFRVREAWPGGIADSAPDDAWYAAFTARRRAAHDAGEEWEAEIGRIESMIAPMIARREARDLRVDPLALWSLSDEFARRFTAEALGRRIPGREFPRAEDLRRLAAYLVQFAAVDVRK